MHKEEYHLLYVLSEPPISVPQTKPHGWVSGDVLVSPNNLTCALSDRFLVLDVNEHGRAMALKLSKISAQVGGHIGYVEIGPNGLDLCEPELGLCIPLIVTHDNLYIATHLSAYCLRLDKVYFEPMITGRNHDLGDIRIIGRFSPISMFKIIQLFDQKSVSVEGNNMKQGQSRISDRASSMTDMTLTDPTSAASRTETGHSSSFDDFLASVYHVERFLDFAYMAFDEVDYSMIREYLGLPKKTFTEPNVSNCDCDDHRKKIVRPDDEGTRNFWRTLDKMIRCAEKLKLDRNPSEILSHLNETSRAIGCQRIISVNFKLMYSR